MESYNVDKLKKKAKILNQRFYLLLEEFKETFLLHKQNEKYELNKNKFNSSKGNLQNFFKEIVIFDNEIENKTNLSLKSLKDDKLSNKKLKNDNKKFNDQVDNLEHGDKTSRQIYLDKKELYVREYVRLIVIVLGLIILSVFLYLVNRDEAYSIGDKISFSGQILIIGIIVFLIILLGAMSLGIRLFDPFLNFLEDRGWLDWFDNFSFSLFY